MTSGDAVNALSSIGTGAYLTIQPGAGVEWIIHNLLVPDGSTSGVEVYEFTGATSLLIATITSSMLSHNFHLTNTYYLKMKNLSTGSVVLGYDGIVVK